MSLLLRRADRLVLRRAVEILEHRHLRAPQRQADQAGKRAAVHRAVGSWINGGRLAGGRHPAVN